MVGDEPVFTDPPTDSLEGLTDEELAELDAAEVFGELLERDTVTDPTDEPDDDQSDDEDLEDDEPAA